MAKQMKAAKVPTDELSYSNRAVISDRDPFANEHHLEIKTSPNHRYVFTLATHPSMVPGQIGFNRPQRSWAMVSLGQDVQATAFKVDRNKHFLASITLEVDFLNKKKTTLEAFNTDEMQMDFLAQFMQLSFTAGQPLVFNWDKMPKYVLSITVKSLEALDFTQGGKPQKANFGIIYKETMVTFDKAEGSPLNLVGKAKGTKSTQSIINPDWNFNQMGIGGLDNEFSSIFRRAFASRVFPPELVDQLGIKHCRGILLFGPPGTGKTLMARQIGKMLNAREPKIVNGPSILDKYVGESEKNIRELFKHAEEEEAKMGPNSGLHIIIFDEIDAICKARGSVAGGTQVHDTVVNQLLAKIDGVDQLNNILVIGMTNRKDMIDDALLRPGRLEVQMEIGLPDENGRVQILNIHTAKIRGNKKMAPDVDIEELARETKNFSGAEIEGLVRASMSTAMNRLIKAADKVVVDPDAHEKLKVTMADFRSALEHDCQPAFGVSLDELEKYCANGIISWGDPVRHVIEDAELLVTQTRVSERTPLITVLLHGPPNSGKTALAAKIARDSQFPFLKICTPENMVGYHETAKCLAIKKVFDDAYKSTLSCVILDDIERLLDYVAIGPRFSNTVLQAMLVLLKKMPPKGRKLLVIGTTSRKDVLEQMEMLQSFMSHIHAPALRRTEQIVNVVEELGAFTDKEMEGLKKELGDRTCCIGVKKLIVLVEMAKQSMEGSREIKLVELLEDEGGMSLQNYT